MLQHKALGQALFDEVCRHLNLLECDYFSLEFTDCYGNRVCFILLISISQIRAYSTAKLTVLLIKLFNSTIHCSFFIFNCYWLNIRESQV